MLHRVTFCPRARSNASRTACSSSSRHRCTNRSWIVKLKNHPQPILRARSTCISILPIEVPLLDGLQLQRRDVANLRHIRRKVQHLAAFERQSWIGTGAAFATAALAGAASDDEAATEPKGLSQWPRQARSAGATGTQHNQLGPSGHSEVDRAARNDRNNYNKDSSFT